VARAITAGPGRTGSGSGRGWRGGGRRGGGSFRGTVFRVGSSLVDYLLLRLAQRFMTPWLLAFVALPALGQLWHAAWGGKWWTWLIALVWGCYGLFEGWLTVGGSLQRFVTMFGALSLSDDSKGWRATLAKVRISGEAAARGGHIRWRAGITIAFAVAGLAAIMTCGVVHGPQWPMVIHTDPWGVDWQWPIVLNDWIALPYLLFAVPLCISWNKARSAMVAGTGEDDHGAKGDDIGPLAKVLGVDKRVDIVGQTKDHELGRAETKVHHPGVTTEQVPSGLGALVSEAGLPRDGHAVLKGNMSDESTIVTMSWSTLDKPQQWLGPYNRGESISTPVRVGIKQNGKKLEIARAPSRPPRRGASPSRNGTSVLIQGYTGAGKTEAVLTEFAESITRCDVVWWWIDTTKAGATADDIRPGIDWLATSDPEAVNMIDAIGPLISYRMIALRKVGLREWEPRAWEDPRCRIPFLIVHIEEFNSLAEALDKTIIRRAEAVRSAGISVSCSSQRASGENMPTGLRSQLGSGWEFGLKDGDDIAFCLSSETIKAGADAEWADTKPGQCYLEAKSADRSEWPVPGRTFDRIPAEALRRHVVAEVTRTDFPWPTLTAGEKRALGKHYATRAMTDLDAWISANGVDLSKSVEELRELALAVDSAIEDTITAEIEAEIGDETPADDDPTDPSPPPPHGGGEDDEPDDGPPYAIRREGTDAVDTLTDPDAAAAEAADRERREEERMRTQDREQAEADVDERRRNRYDDDPDTDARSLMSKGSGLAPDRALDDLIVDPEDDIEFGVPDTAVPMDTDEQRNEAFDHVLRDLFGKKGGTRPEDYIDVDTSEIGKLWAAAGGFSTGNPRSNMLYRLNALVDQGYASRIREGKGRKPAQWRIFRKAIQPPAEIVNTEPDLDDVDDEGGEDE
jgi:hypothetical protein